MNTITIYKKNLYYLVIVTLIYFGIFLHLGSNTIRPWDESRTAINAVEMSFTGNYLYRTFDYKPENWETKPPLLIWLQVLCLKTIGYNELAIRLPSAIAACLSIIFLIVYINKKYESLWHGLVLTLMLLTSHGFLYIHNARTGDHDALLIFFEILMIVSFYEFLEQKKNKYLIYTFIFFTCCYFTKSVAVFPFLPAMFLYVLIQKKLLYLLKNKYLYIGVLIPIIIIASYYLLVEMYVPGYIKKALYEDLFVRYNKVASYYYNGYYYDFLTKVSYKYIYLLPIAIILLITNYRKKYNLLLFFILICGFIWFSLPKGTPNTWYLAPMLPLLSVIITVTIIDFIFKYLSDYNYYIKHTILFLLIVGIFLNSYKNIIKTNLIVDKEHNDLQYGFVLSILIKEYPTIKNITMYNNESTHTSGQVYQEIYNKLYNYRIHRVYDLDKSLKQFDTVLTHIDNAKNVFSDSTNFKSTKIFEARGCALYSISKK
jgi:4-amino-4-deoxy-L-arabinose transferase-like glycosyltransferase